MKKNFRWQTNAFSGNTIRSAIHVRLLNFIFMRHAGRPSTRLAHEKFSMVPCRKCNFPRRSSRVGNQSRNCSEKSDRIKLILFDNNRWSKKKEEISTHCFLWRFARYKFPVGKQTFQHTANFLDQYIVGQN